MIKRMVNTDRGFYGYMGKIFGSREIQRETADRFYDDDGKEWVLDIGKGKVLSVVSVKDSVLKNVYTEDAFSLVRVLGEVYGEVYAGTVPAIYREMYAAAGYTVTGEKKNFLVVRGGRADG